MFTVEGSPFSARPISSRRQGRPQKAGEFTGDGGNGHGGACPPSHEAAIATIQALLGAPRGGAEPEGLPLLPAFERASQVRLMAVVPGRLDQDTPQMRVAGARNAPPPDARSTGVFRRDKSDEGHHGPGRWEASGVAEFHGEHQGAEGVDAPEAAQARDSVLERRLGHERLQVCFDVVEPTPRFIDGAQIVRMGVCERRQLPLLGAEPLVILGAPRSGAGEPPPVPEDKLSEPLPRAEHIPPNGLSRTHEIPCGFFGVRGYMDRRQRARAMQDRQLGGIPAVRFDPVSGADPLRRVRLSRRPPLWRPVDRMASSPIRPAVSVDGVSLACLFVHAGEALVAR